MNPLHLSALQHDAGYTPYIWKKQGVYFCCYKQHTYLQWVSIALQDYVPK
jgi:hypothetical protein